MPANLPPEYFEADKRFKQASTPAEKIAALEDLIATVPKHKGTDKLRADLRRRLSQLREEALKKSKKGGRGSLYTIQREGAAQIALVGFPNTGKSSLLASLTNANPVIADYPLSTLIPLPGMMPFEDIQIQLVDLPPVGNESTDGWVSSILRNADALLLIIDISEDTEIQTELLIERLTQWNIHIIKKGEVVDRRHFGIFKKAVLVANKKDLLKTDESLTLTKLMDRYSNLYPMIAISVRKRENLEELKHAIFEISGIIRVYSKEPGKEPDLSMPFTIPSNSTILDLAGMIHKDFITGLKYACVWGSSRFPGQKVQKDYVLKDKDIVEFHV
ncbi:MAG: GTPase [Nitrospirota bacterium]